MNEKTQDDDNYELPPGIVLPEDNSSPYPNWKKGLLSGIPCGIFCAFILAVSPLGKSPLGKFGFGVLGFLMGFSMAGAIVAFRPPKN